MGKISERGAEVDDFFVKTGMAFGLAFDPERLENLIRYARERGIVDEERLRKQFLTVLKRDVVSLGLPQKRLSKKIGFALDHKILGLDDVVGFYLQNGNSREAIREVDEAEKKGAVDAETLDALRSRIFGKEKGDLGEKIFSLVSDGLIDYAISTMDYAVGKGFFSRDELREGMIRYGVPKLKEAVKNFIGRKALDAKKSRASCAEDLIRIKRKIGDLVGFSEQDYVDIFEEQDLDSLEEMFKDFSIDGMNVSTLETPPREFLEMLKDMHKRGYPRVDDDLIGTFFFNLGYPRAPVDLLYTTHWIPVDLLDDIQQQALEKGGKPKFPVVSVNEPTNNHVREMLEGSRLHGFLYSDPELDHLVNIDFTSDMLEKMRPMMLGDASVGKIEVKTPEMTPQDVFSQYIQHDVRRSVWKKLSGFAEKVDFGNTHQNILEERRHFFNTIRKARAGKTTEAGERRGPV